MAIKLFFKHLLTSIRKRPVQPIILSVVITVAVVVCVLALELQGFLVGEQEMKFNAQNGNATISVSVSSASGGRFLDADKVKTALGEDAKYVGTYALPFYIGENKDFYFGVSTDISRVKDVFSEINYSSDTAFPAKGSKTQARKCAFVTKEFANKYGLSIGSDITVNLLGIDTTYEVFGIVEDVEIMGSYSLMIDTEGIRNALPQGIRSLMEHTEFKPCGKILVSVDENRVSDAIKKLEAVYPDSNVAFVAFSPDNINENLGIVVKLVVMLTIVFAVLTIYACFAILATQRKDENALFYAVGSKAYMLNLLSMAEMFIYWIFGLALGIGLSFPVAKGLGVIANFEYLNPTVSPKAVAIAGAVVLAGTELGMVVFILMDKIKKMRAKKGIVRKKNPLVTNGLSIGLAGGIIVCLIVSLTVKQMYNKYLPALIGLMLLSVTLFYGGRNVFTKVSEKLSTINKLPVTIRYAIKNSSRVESQANVAGLVAMFLVICTLLAVMLNFAIKSNEMYKRTIDADFLVVNATEDAKTKLRNTEGVKENGVFDVYSGEAFTPTGASLILVCASDREAVNAKFEIEKLPDEGEVVLSDIYMRRDGYKIDDDYTMVFDGTEYIFKIVGSARMNGRVVFANVDSLGIKYNYVSVRGENGFDSGTLYNNINKSLELDNTTVMPIGNLLEETIETNSRSIDSIEIIYAAMLIFAAIGLGDSIASGYRSRRDEFDCFAGAGMNKKSLRQMKAAEISYAFLMGIIMFGIAIGIAYVLMDQACLGFMMDLRFV